MKIASRVLLLLLIMTGLILAQGRQYEGPDDEAGDISAEREGWMTGNRVLLYFQNTTELSYWFDGIGGSSNWSRWPNTYQGVRMLDGIGLLIGAKVYLKNDTIPVTDADEIEADGENLDSLFYLQTSYREEMDENPKGTVEWGIYPVFGYFNEKNDYPAMSNRPSSWPVAGWPASGDELKWQGEWDGRFGRGVTYADLETYFVANDAQDQEYLGLEDRVKYYPRPGHFIGDKNPIYVTVQQGLPWGGIGVRVEQRGFQWNNPQARDAIFWEYEIANISDYDLPYVAFGYWVDNAIGGESDDELGYFDTKVDMAYSWDIDGLGYTGIKTGAMGFAYLESPGLPYDGEDNDLDGLVDEKRNNDAGIVVGPQDGIYNLTNFLEAYNLTVDDLRDHYEGDEDQDWEDGEDLNNDGIYQTNENPGDDLGLDGVGPGELNYTEPDEGECNHKPDYKQGIGCEPNFAATDVTESDMVGLTSFYLFPVPQHTPPFNRWFRNDQSMWTLIGQDTLVEYLGNISNLVETFASGPFPLYQGSEERISMSELHAYDQLEGLSSATHEAPALYAQKRIVQVIYEKDYRFAQPPRMPSLTASPGDGKVILTWDNTADTRTRDPFMGNVNDFEGYKLFRATDKFMSDSKVITDGFGDASILKPIFQCDKKNGKRGFAPYGAVNGAEYNLGYDTGIVHHFVDQNVQNGRTYYYAIVAYDSGAPNIGPGIAPSENNIVIELDESEEVRVLEDGSLAVGKNVAVVVPRQDAAGYLAPSIDQTSEQNTKGSGTVTPEILADYSLKTSHTYSVKFNVDTLSSLMVTNHAAIYVNNGLRVYDVTAGNQLVYEENPDNFAYSNIILRDSLDYYTLANGTEFSTDVFDGMRLTINLPVEMPQYDANRSGWLVGSAPLLMMPAIFDKSNLALNNMYFAWDYEIIFTDNDSAFVSQLPLSNLRDEARITIRRDQLIFKQNYNFYVINKNFVDENGDYEKMELVVHDKNTSLKFDLGDRVLVAGLTKDNRFAGTAFAIDFSAIQDSSALPKPNDVYRVYHQRPFWSTDSITFTIQPGGELQENALKATMDDIKVVPNPYVASNAMEPAVSNKFLNQRRRIMFTHIPAECTIKIFTVSGLLVDQIDVQNTPDNGIVHWDLTTSEGLEIAAGIYIYHIKATRTGDEKIGKFAIVK